MDQPDLILEKLRRAEAELPPEEHSPNMLNLRAGLEAGSAALDELEASERAREDDGPRATADTAPHLFKGLVLFLQAQALALGGAGQGAGYAPVLEHVPSASSRGLDALGVLKLLCQPMCQMAAGNPAGVARALQQAGAVLEKLWPSAADRRRHEARRLLSSRDWVPYVPPRELEGEGGASQQPAPPPDTPLVANLRAALERHCPDISPEDLYYAALVVRAHLGWDYAATSDQLQGLLQESQAMIDSGDTRYINAYFFAGRGAVLAARLLRNTAARRETLRQFLEGATERCMQARCWLTAAEMAAMQGSWAASDLDSLARGARPSAGEQARLRRQAGGPASYAEELKERAESAVQQLRDLEPRIKPWAPSFSLRRLREERRAFERQLGLRAGEPDLDDALNALNVMPRCDGCGRPALQLKKCSACKVAAYCSRECQKAAWRAGHKEECASMAQQRGG